MSGIYVRHRETGCCWCQQTWAFQAAKPFFCVVKLWHYHNTFSWNSRLRHWEVLLNKICMWFYVSIFRWLCLALLLQMEICTSTEIKSFKVLFRAVSEVSLPVWVTIPNVLKAPDAPSEPDSRTAMDVFRDVLRWSRLKLKIICNLQQSTFYEYVLPLWLTLEWSASDVPVFLHPYKLACHICFTDNSMWGSSDDLWYVVWRVFVLNAMQQSVEACAGPLLPKLGCSAMFPSKHSWGSYHNVPTSIGPMNSTAVRQSKRPLIITCTDKIYIKLCACTTHVREDIAEWTGKN